MHINYIILLYVVINSVTHCAAFYSVTSYNIIQYLTQHFIIICMFNYACTYTCASLYMHVFK